jgi:hypothetical protein
VLRQYRVLLLIAGIIVLFTTLAVYFGRSPSADPIRDHSVLRTNAWGLKALAELCRLHGLPVDVWDEPLSKLTGEQRFLCLFDPSLPVSDDELEALVAWVKRGGRLLVAVDLNESHNMLFGDERAADGPDTRLLAALGLTGKAVGPATSWARPVTKAPELREVTRVFVPGPHRLLPLSEAKARQALVHPQWRTLIADGAGAVLMQAPIGQGAVWVLAEVEALSNRNLPQGDNVVLATNLLFSPGHERVAFEERLHMQSRPLSMEAGELPLRPLRLALWAAVGALALYLVGLGWRFGRPVPIHEKPRRSAMEFVEALADLYRKAGATEAVWQLLRQSFRRRLAAEVGLPQELPAERLAEALARRRRVDQTRVQAVLAELDHMPEKPTEEDLMRVARQAAAIEEAMTRE